MRIVILIAAALLGLPLATSGAIAALPEAGADAGFAAGAEPGAPSPATATATATCGNLVKHDPSTFQPDNLEKTVDDTPFVSVRFSHNEAACGIASHWMTLDDLQDGNAPTTVPSSAYYDGEGYVVYYQVTAALPPGYYQVVVFLEEAGGGGRDIVAWNFYVVTVCDDGLDNDGDGVADFPADPGCASSTDTSERGTLACDDGSDNDGDGRADYPDDFGCTGPGDGSESATCAVDDPLVVFCLGASSESYRQETYRVDTAEGAEHTVAGYVEMYRFLVPDGPALNVPCVRLVADATVNPCALAGGSYQHTMSVLFHKHPHEPTLEPSGAVRVCNGELKLTVLGAGIESAQVLLPC